MEHEVFIALGSNLGSRLENLRAAREYLQEVLEIRQISSVYETEPWGYEEQPRFLNQVVQGSTRISPTALLAALKAIEARMGREKTFRYGPRLIDLDLLSYDNLIWQSQELTIPHPELHKRSFVLVPLEEIAPQWEHPVDHKTVAEMAAEIDREGVVVFANEEHANPQEARGVKMTGEELKPLKWRPGPEVGFTVERRPDGGMNFTFQDVEPETLEVWRRFALDHLIDSDRLTRNRYDVRQIDDLPEEAIEIAVEANSDPSARNIRLAVVVSKESVGEKIRRVADLTAASGVEMRVFIKLDEAEAWLSRPINLMV